MVPVTSSLIWRITWSNERIRAVGGSVTFWVGRPYVAVMDDALRARIERDAERHALANAVKHDGTANIGAVIGPLMGENPEYRSHSDTVPEIVAAVVETVNELTATERHDRLAELAPELLETVDDTGPADERTLGDLPNADAVDQVRMRCAPNPNGPWHIGHARMPAVIGTYKARYDGWMLCRFDDTDPETKRPDLAAYDAILDTIEYLGFEADMVITASDRLDIYYDHARQLIEAEGAYTCTCPGREFSDLKNRGLPCPHRDKEQSTSLDELEEMIAGVHAAGSYVLRVKTDIEHPNPAIRDWVGLRLVDTPHPRPEASEYRCWPTLDFQSAIDDHLMEITHIIRGIDLQDSARRQQFIYDRFGWSYPELVHWGHVQVDEYDIKMSTSAIRALIEGGDLDGWDDPRAPTIASLQRRGIRGAALTEAMTDLGTSTSDVELSMSTVYAKNRELIDDKANRYFLVLDPIERQVVGPIPETAHPPQHPDRPDGHTRTIPVGDAVRIESADLPASGDRVWLKGLGCLRHLRDAFEVTGDDISVVRDEDVPVIHWVPADDTVPVTLRRPDGDVSGIAEPEFADARVDSIVQFERVGFARVDAHGSDGSVAYFAHR